MLKDFLESFRVNWIARLSSPLFAALAISWAVWNHRMIFTLFSDKPIHWRFAYIDDVLYPDVGVIVQYHLLLPTVTALIYLFLYPIPAKKVFDYTLRRKVELNDLAKQIEGTRLLTAEDAQKMRDQMAEVEAARSTAEAEFQSTSKLLTDSNSVLSDQVRGLKRDLVRERAMAISIRPDEARSRIEDFLRSVPFMLVFNTKIDRERGSKTVVFGSGNTLTMGANRNEHTWSVTNEGTLLFIEEDGSIHSQFNIDPIKGRFVGTVDASGQQQFMSAIRVT